MVINVEKTRKKKRNLFMTDDEVAILWNYSKRWGPKFQMMISFALFRGLRIGEIVAINILDFMEDYTKIRVILEKSHIEDILPLIPEHTEMIKDYISRNYMSFRNGYLFPYYTSNRTDGHMTSRSAVSLFFKYRSIIAKEHPSFDEKYPDDERKDGKITHRHRISFHSGRRWFETTMSENDIGIKKIADIMRYRDPSTVNTYLDPYRTWRDEKKILQEVFGAKASLFSTMNIGQKRIDSFF